VQIAILLFDGFDAADVVALHRASQLVPGVDSTFVSTHPGPWRDESGQLEFSAHAALHEVPRPRVLMVPGGSGAKRASQSRAVRHWVAGAVVESAWLVAIGDGVLLADGLVRNRRVAAPHRLHAALQVLGAEIVANVMVLDAPLATATTAEHIPRLVSDLYSQIK